MSGRGRWREREKLVEYYFSSRLDNAEGLCARRSIEEGCLFWEWLIFV